MIATLESLKIRLQKNKKNYDMLHEVINYQLVNNYKIYDLRLELKYIEKLQSIYRYTYFFQKEYLYVLRN